MGEFLKPNLKGLDLDDPASVEKNSLERAIRSENMALYNDSLSKEERKERRKKQIKTLGPDGLSRIAKNREANRTEEDHEVSNAVRHNTNIERYGEDYAFIRAEKTAIVIGKERRIEINKNGCNNPEKVTPEMRSANGKLRNAKSQETRKAIARENYLKILEHLNDEFTMTELKLVLSELGFRHSYSKFFLKSEFVEEIPPTAKITWVNPRRYKKITSLH